MEQSTLSDSTRMPAAQVETRDPDQEARVAAILASPSPEPAAHPDAAIIALADTASLEELAANIRCNAAEDPPKGKDGPSFFDRSYDLLEQVTATRPITLAGIAAKARVMLTHVGRGAASDNANDLGSDHAVCTLALSLARDAVRLDHALADLPQPPLPTRQPEVASQADAALLDLGRQWERAATFYATKHAEMIAVSEAVEGTGPGPAPRGTAYQKWLDEVDEWRDRTGVGEAEEASGDALTALGEVEDLIAATKATTPEGLRVKARVGQRCEDTEIEWPDGLAAGLVADLLAGAPLAISSAALLADRDAGEPDPIFAALDACRAPEAEREAFHAVHSVGKTGPGYTFEREMALDDAVDVAFDAVFATTPTTRAGRLALTAFIERRIEWSACPDGSPQEGEDTVFANAYRTLARVIEAEVPEVAEEAIAEALHRAVDLKALDIKDLSHLAFWAESLMTMASGLARRGGRRPLGRFFDQVSNGLSDVVGKAQNELQGRTPADWLERECRLKTIALPVIENGDADELESLIADLQVEVAYLRQPLTAGVAR